MKVEVFVQSGKEDVARWVKDAVADFLDPHIPVEISVVSTGEISTGARYSQLLRASIPPELGLKIEIKRLEWMQDHIYLHVYWQVFVGFWLGNYYYSQEQKDFISGQNLEMFFPAVAIRDRMLFVPVGQLQLLQNLATRQQTPWSAAEYDLIEVDFRDEPTVRTTIRDSKRVLAAQLKLELGAWSSYQPPGPIDFRAAARDLDVQPGFLQALLKDEIADARRRYEKAACKLSRTLLPRGRWSRVELTLCNHTDRDMPAVTVTVTGPVGVRPNRATVDLPTGVERTVEIALRPEDLGEFPIEITLVQEQDAPLAEWIPPHHVWIESVGDST